MKQLVCILALLISQVTLAATTSYPALKGRIYNSSALDLSRKSIQLRLNCSSYGMFNVKNCGSTIVKASLNSDGSFTLPATEFKSSGSFFSLETKYMISLGLVSEDGAGFEIFTGTFDNVKQTSKIHPLFKEVTLLDMPTQFIKVKSQVNCKAGSMFYRMILKAQLSNGLETSSPEILRIARYTGDALDEVSFDLSTWGQPILRFIGGKVSKSDKMSFEVIIDQFGTSKLHHDKYLANGLEQGWTRAINDIAITPKCE